MPELENAEEGEEGGEDSPEKTGKYMDSFYCNIVSNVS